MIKPNSKKEEDISISEKRKKVEAFLNDSFVNNSDNILFDNLDILLRLAYFIYDQLLDYFEEVKPVYEIKRISKSDFLTNKKLIEKFYETHGVSFNFDDIISDGTFNFTLCDKNDINLIYSDSIQNFNFTGNNTYDNDHKNIEVYNTGLIIDSSVWIHEIAHYRNQPKNGRNQINDLLTEAISFATQLIYSEYLINLGYEYEGTCCIYDILDVSNNNATYSIPIIRFYLLYSNFGDVSKETYENVYNDEPYESALNKFLNYMQNHENHTFLSILWYIVGSLLSVYMYNEYKKNPGFFAKIEALNESIISKSLTECLNIIGLTSYENESKKKVEEAFARVKNELKEKLNQKKEMFM